MKPNIDRRGRIARAISGAITLAAGVACIFLQWPESPVWRWTLGVILVLGGLFQFYEAKNSWCVARACGMKTPM